MTNASARRCGVWAGVARRCAIVLASVPWAIGLSTAAPTRYVYDDLNRLVRVERADGILVTYAYDALGNRLSKRVIHDMDFDDAPDSTDCAPTDPTAFAIPAEVTGQSIAMDKTTLSWSSAVPLAGSGTVHDVLRGALSELPVGNKPSETCLALGVSGATMTEPSDPVIGQGRWYLVRARNVCGVGTYGTQSNGTPRVSTVCP